MLENSQLSQPSWWVRLLIEATWTKTVEVEMLSEDAPPLLPPKVLVDVADGDLPEVDGAARHFTGHLDAGPKELDFSCWLAGMIQD